MRSPWWPRPVVLGCAVLFVAGAVMATTHAIAVAAPTSCDGKPATIVGTAGDDVLKGTAGDDVIVGLAGNDTIRGLDGNDTICGKDSDDVLIGGSGNDTLLGGRGFDWVGHGLAPNGVQVDLAAGVATGWGSDQLRSIETVIGSQLDDELRARDTAKTIRGLDGRDDIKGRGGPDHVMGGPGSDWLSGGGGNDVVDGHDGIDTLSGGWGADILRGGPNSDWIEPGGGDDIVRGGGGSNTLIFGAAPAGVVGRPRRRNRIGIWERHHCRDHNGPRDETRRRHIWQQRRQHSQRVIR